MEERGASNSGAVTPKNSSTANSLLEEQLGGATIRRKLAALSSLSEYLRESNPVTHNPLKGVKRPPVESWQGKTPALGDAQAHALLKARDAGRLRASATGSFSPPYSQVQEWRQHANIATTRIYDHRKTRSEESPTFKVSY